MPIKIFNTMGRTLQEFIPINSQPDADGKIEVKMYHCGPTVYWDQHIGNMRAVVFADLFKRALEYNVYQDSDDKDFKYKVNLVRNYTDVGHLTGDNIGDADTGEDRMDRAASREGLTPDAIADKYIASFQRDITLLNADIKADSTDTTDSACTFIQRFIDNLNLASSAAHQSKTRFLP